MKAARRLLLLSSIDTLNRLITVSQSSTSSTPSSSSSTSSPTCPFTIASFLRAEGDTDPVDDPESESESYASVMLLLEVDAPSQEPTLDVADSPFWAWSFLKGFWDDIFGDSPRLSIGSR
jgi:hypothetical protein